MAVALYLAAVALTVRSGLLPVRPVFDGLAPLPPYRWVNPPAELARENQPPQPGRGTIPLTPTGSAYGSVVTGDGQVIVSASRDSFAPRVGEREVVVTITPLEPATLAPPPRGLRFDGNAYRVDVVYATSGVVAPLRRAATVVLRYPIHATELLRAEGSDSGWALVTSYPLPASQQIYTQAGPRLGTYVAAGSPQVGGLWARWRLVVIIAVIVAAAVAAVVALRSRVGRAGFHI